MNQEQYELAISQLGTIAGLMLLLDLEEAYKAAKQADETGWFLDPTAWQRGHKSLEALIKLIEAGQKFQNAAREYQAFAESSQHRLR